MFSYHSCGVIIPICYIMRCSITLCWSPWYDLRGWLGVKSQSSIYLRYAVNILHVGLCDVMLFFNCYAMLPLILCRFFSKRFLPIARTVSDDSAPTPRCLESSSPTSTCELVASRPVWCWRLPANNTRTSGSLWTRGVRTSLVSTALKCMWPSGAIGWRQTIPGHPGPSGDVGSGQA